MKKGWSVVVVLLLTLMGCQTWPRKAENDLSVEKGQAHKDNASLEQERLWNEIRK